MIRENFIEIKSFVNPHPPDVVQELANRVTVLPGRVAVLCDPHVESQLGILVAGGKYRGSQDSDTGVVIGSGVKSLKVGARVGFLPMHGLHCTHEHFDWVPPGLEVRFYGVACSIYNSILLLES